MPRMLRFWRLLLLGLTLTLAAFASRGEEAAPTSALNHPAIELECDLVLRHVDGFGIGVYAGRMFAPYELIERSIGVVVPNELTANNDLENYVDTFNSSHDLISLGYSMMFNHNPAMDGIMTFKGPGNLPKYQMPDPLVYFRDGSGRSHDHFFFARFTIFPGEQIFTFYGDGWFASRRGRKPLLLPGQEHISSIDGDGVSDGRGAVYNPADLEAPLDVEFRPRMSLNVDILRIQDVLRGKGRIPGCPTRTMTLHERGTPKPSSHTSLSATPRAAATVAATAVAAHAAAGSAVSGSIDALPQQPQVSSTILSDSHQTWRTMANPTLIALEPIKKGQIIEVARALLFDERFALRHGGTLTSYLWFKPPSARRLHRLPAPPLHAANALIYDHSGRIDYAMIVLGNGALYRAAVESPTFAVTSSVAASGDEMKKRRGRSGRTGRFQYKQTITTAWEANIEYAYWDLSLNVENRSMFFAVDAAERKFSPYTTARAEGEKVDEKRAANQQPAVCETDIDDGQGRDEEARDCRDQQDRSQFKNRDCKKESNEKEEEGVFENDADAFLADFYSDFIEDDEEVEEEEGRDREGAEGRENQNTHPTRAEAESEAETPHSIPRPSAHRLRRTASGIPCSTRMLVAFYAKRDIAPGEELTIDLDLDRDLDLNPSSSGNRRKGGEDKKIVRRFTTQDFAVQCL